MTASIRRTGVSGMQMAVVDDLGLFLAHEPDAKVDAALARMRRNLNAEFCALFPMAAPETMAAGVDTIIRSIQTRRREIERGGH